MHLCYHSYLGEWRWKLEMNEQRRIWIVCVVAGVEGGRSGFYDVGWNATMEKRRSHGVVEVHLTCHAHSFEKPEADPDAYIRSQRLGIALFLFQGGATLPPANPAISEPVYLILGEECWEPIRCNRRATLKQSGCSEPRRNGCRDFALLAQETEPLLDGSDQILVVVDVLIVANKHINNNPDWYSILQLDSRRNDDGLIKRQYRRLALLLPQNGLRLSESTWI
ncbi:hypothetical protein L6452_35642 [Arctium lappa]|uniref:Uncharacterized protein n=1 Tax=Arctium lappa TaxID=4217 RepID=A0ACB8Y709_ARCLA|nr:hypothetical protein L6452_35642 [Arctium lappa]